MSVATAAGAARAQNYGAGSDRVVSFGDSLTDNGNLFIADGGTYPPSPPYNQRFTNVITFAEILNGPMSGFFAPLSNTANVNFAFGGARTTTTGTTPPQPAPPLPPSSQTQIGAYLLGGGQFTPSTVVTYWIGANNIFQGTAFAAGNPATAVAYMTAVDQAAAADVQTQLGQIGAAGAKTVLVYNLPDFGSLPNYTALGPQAIALASYSTTTYNSLLSQAVGAAAAANRGTNYVQVDVNSAFAAVIANPSAYGFSNVTAACVTTPACVTGTLAQQDQYLFWDPVHPTYAGHQLLATLTFMYLDASSLSAGVGGLARSGFDAERGLALGALDEQRRAAPRLGITDFRVAAIGMTDRIDPALPATGVGASAVPSEITTSSSLVGLELSAMRGLTTQWSAFYGLEALGGSMSSGFVSSDQLTFGGHVGAVWRDGPAFVNATLGASYDAYPHYKRTSLLAANVLTADVGAQSFSAAAEFGYDFGLGGVTATPMLRLAALTTHVDGFTETGGFAGLRYGGQTLTGLAATPELEIARRFAGGDLRFDAGYEALVAKSNGPPSAQFVNNTAGAFSVATPDLSSPGLQLGAGADFAVGGSWTASADYRASVGAGAFAQQGKLELTTRW
ncbi:MAG: autotransporter domain-containing protein [Hyphomicrobiales bacterium]|nr:autotransporter domain-containing protein [Hyphomicrobiales bacterium]